MAMPTKLDEARINSLREKARRLYWEYSQQRGFMDDALYQYLSTVGAERAHDFDEAMETLQNIDPEFPAPWKPLVVKQGKS